MYADKKFVKTEFGKRLRFYRQSKKMTQLQLGKLTKLGSTAISKFESGERSPSLYNLMKIVDALGISGDQILGRKTEELV